MKELSFQSRSSRKWIIGTMLVMIFFAFTLTSVLGFSQNANSVTGYEEGIHSATNLGKGNDKTPDGLKNALGFYNGIGTGFLMGEEGKLHPTLIYDDIQKISEIASLLNVDVVSFIDRMGQRADGFNIFLQELLNQKDYVLQRQDILDKQHTALQSAYTAAQQKQDHLQTVVFDAIDHKYPFEAEDNLNKFLDVKSTTGSLFTKVKILEVLQDKYALAIMLLTQKIKFLSANRNALIKGVKVVDITDPNIKLILSEEEWKKTME